MITKDGLKWEKCFLENDSLLIDGASYPIENLKEITNYRILLCVIIGMLAIGSILYVPMVFLVINKIVNPKIVSVAWKNILFFLSFAPLTTGWVFFIHQFVCSFKYRGYWTINHYHALWIEKDDQLELVNILRQIERKLPTTIPKKNFPPEVAILSIIAVILVPISFLLRKINEILLPLSITCTFIIIILAALLHGIKGCNRAKWKK